MKPQEALNRIIEHREIFHDEMLSLMRQIMRGELPQTLVAAIITGLRVKKETIGEIAAAAQVMREFSARVEVLEPVRIVLGWRAPTQIEEDHGGAKSRGKHGGVHSPSAT